jgi:ATP-dependent Clp protease ATP-binding subunit ClpC
MYPYERFSPTARDVLALAQKEAETQDHSYIGTEHLLLALAAAESGAAARALRRLDATADRIRPVIARVLPPPDRPILAERIPTSRVKTVIELAFQEADASGSESVGTSELLLGILKEGEGIAAHILVDFGCTIERVTETLDEVGRAD